MPVEMMKEIVRKLVSTHRKLYEIALKKKEAIKTGDAPLVGRLTLQEMPLIDEVRSLEDRRAEQVKRDLPFAADTPTFREWEAAAVSDAERPEWHNLYLELANSVLVLKQANRLNQDLLRQSLQWVRLSMNLFQPPIQSANYGDPRSNQLSASTYSFRIDSRA